MMKKYSVFFLVLATVVLFGCSKKQEQEQTQTVQTSPPLFKFGAVADVQQILEKYDCVVAYFNGHGHRGNYGEKNGVHYVNLQGMVETRDETAYAVVEVYEDHLKVTGFGREPSRVLRY